MDILMPCLFSSNYVLSNNYNTLMNITKKLIFKQPQDVSLNMT